MANARFTIPLLISLLGGALAIGAGGSITGCGGGSTSGSGGGGGGSACDIGADGCFDYTCFKGDAPVGFKADVLPILRNSCGLSSSCHGNENGSGAQHYLGPKLMTPDVEPTAAQIQKIFDQSVGQPTVVDTGMNNITPNDPEHSFFMYKLDGLACSKLKCAADGTCGALMPQGSSKPMDADKRDIIRRWIAQGAKND